MATTTLFKLLTADCTVIINGYEVESVSDYATDSKGKLVMRCEDAAENDWYFVDQEVNFKDGSCVAKSSFGDPGTYKTGVNLTFFVKRLMTLEDLPEVSLSEVLAT